MCQRSEDTPSRGAPCQYLAGGAGPPRLLPTREAEICPPASYSDLLWRNGLTHERLRREFRNVHQHTIQGAHQTLRKEPTSTAKLRVDLFHLSSDPKYSNALPSSPLRLRAACVPHTLHPTDEFDAPSVRKDTQPETHKECSHHKGSLRSTSRISSLLTSMRVCALGLRSKVGRSKAAVGQGSQGVCFTAYKKQINIEIR
jgi:hypothetical protein